MQRFTGEQVERAIRMGGGLWKTGDIAEVVERNRTAVQQWIQGGKLKPVARVGADGRWPMFCGEDIVDFLERSGKWWAAEKMHEAIQVKRLQRFGNPQAIDRRGAPKGAARP